MQTLITSLFHIIEGKKEMSESEITEATYIKLKLPTFITFLVALGTLTFSGAVIYINVKSNEKEIEQKVSITEYRIDRKIDSISAANYRSEFTRLLNEINNKLQK